MTFYQKLIQRIGGVTPEQAKGVEASMRLQYGTLSHLSRETFAKEIKLYLACEKADPGFGASVAASFGL